MITICVFFRHTPQSTDGDFEELMNRNRAVSSSAISKAVSGAAAGKCGSKFLEVEEGMQNLISHVWKGQVPI